MRSQMVTTVLHQAEIISIIDVSDWRINLIGSLVPEKTHALVLLLLTIRNSTLSFLWTAWMTMKRGDIRTAPRLTALGSNRLSRMRRVQNLGNKEC
jgi:hypothetical protein